MYNLASKICFMCRGFLALKRICLLFFQINQMIIYIRISEILKLAFKTCSQNPFVFMWAGREY